MPEEALSLIETHAKKLIHQDEVQQQYLPTQQSSNQNNDASRAKMDLGSSKKLMGLDELKIDLSHLQYSSRVVSPSHSHLMSDEGPHANINDGSSSVRNYTQNVLSNTLSLPEGMGRKLMMKKLAANNAKPSQVIPITSHIPRRVGAGGIQRSIRGIRNSIQNVTARTHGFNLKYAFSDQESIK